MNIVQCFSFLAELFTTAMFFNWKGARTKCHEKWDFIVISGLWLVNQSVTWLFEWDLWRFRAIFTTSQMLTRHIFAMFSLLFTTFTPRIYTTRNFHDIFSLRFHHKFTPQRDEKTGTNRLHGDTQTDFHYRLDTTNLHYEFSPQISLSWECDLGDKQTKISLETVVSSNILIHSSGNSVKKGCTDKFSPHVVKN